MQVSSVIVVIANFARVINLTIKIIDIPKKNRQCEDRRRKSSTHRRRYLQAVIYSLTRLQKILEEDLKSLKDRPLPMRICAVSVPLSNNATKIFHHIANSFTKKGRMVRPYVVDQSQHRIKSCGIVVIPHNNLSFQNTIRERLK